MFRGRWCRPAPTTSRVRRFCQRFIRNGGACQLETDVEGRTSGIPHRSGERSVVDVPGRDMTRDEAPILQRISADYFATMKIPLIRGRVWSDSESAGTPHVAVVNQRCGTTGGPGHRRGPLRWSRIERGAQQGCRPVVDRQSERSGRARRRQPGAVCRDDDVRRDSSEPSGLDSAGRRASDRLNTGQPRRSSGAPMECVTGLSVNDRP
jgi:hypothetical protein